MMLDLKSLMSVALACAVSAPMTATAEMDATCDNAPSSIAVKVRGVRSDHGTVTFVLYSDDPDEFLVRGKKLMKERFPARTGTVEFCLPVSAPGTYAAAVYHDEDGNGKLRKNWIGMPKEGFGVSNNPDYWVVPSHEEAAFQVQGPHAPVDIKLKY